MPTRLSSERPIRTSVCKDVETLERSDIVGEKETWWSPLGNTVAGPQELSTDSPRDPAFPR